MIWQNEGMCFSLWGMALAVAMGLAACGSDSSSGGVNGSGCSSSATPSSSAYSSSSAEVVSLSSSAWAISYGEMTDARDGQVYKTVVIGTQTWMAENLNYKVDSSWCYDDNAGFCAKYGRLYQWAAAMGISAAYNEETWGGSDADHRGVCPSGWHLPSDAEWTTLVNFAGDKNIAGTKLKSTDGWSKNPDEDEDLILGTDAYGFSALPAGFRYIGGSFYAGNYASFWSATEYSADDAYDRYLNYGYADMGANNDTKIGEFSVRCVKD